MERKYTKRFEAFKHSLEALAEARERDMNDSFVLSGTGAKFSITFDLAWKTMKDILIEHYAIVDFVAGSPREVLRKAFQAGMISGDEWMQMLEIRNQLAHDYDGEIVKAHCQTIVKTYLNKFEEFQTRAEKLLWERE